MPPNIVGLNLWATVGADEEDPQVTIIHEHGALDSEGDTEWGYAPEQVDVPAFVGRLVSVLQDYLDGETPEFETIRVTHLIKTFWENDAR